MLTAFVAGAEPDRMTLDASFAAVCIANNFPYPAPRTQRCRAVGRMRRIRVILAYRAAAFRARAGDTHRVRLYRHLDGLFLALARNKHNGDADAGSGIVAVQRFVRRDQLAPANGRCGSRPFARSIRIPVYATFFVRGIVMTGLKGRLVAGGWWLVKD